MDPGEAAAYYLLHSTMPPDRFISVCNPMPRFASPALTCRPRRVAHWNRDSTPAVTADDIVQACVENSISTIERSYSTFTFGRWMKLFEREDRDNEWTRLNSEIWVCLILLLLFFKTCY